MTQPRFSNWSANSLMLVYRILAKENSVHMWAMRDAIIQEIRLEAFDRILEAF